MTTHRITAAHARLIAGLTTTRKQMLSHLDDASRAFAKLSQPQPWIAVTIDDAQRQQPPGKLADASIHFITGPLAGLKLIGFGIWERRTGGGRNVTFPARQYSVNGERRSFALLRPTTDTTAQERIREMMLNAYDRYEQTQTTRTEYDQDGSPIQQTPPAAQLPTEAQPAAPPAAQASTTTTTPEQDPPIGQDLRPLVEPVCVPQPCQNTIPALEPPAPVVAGALSRLDDFGRPEQVRPATPPRPRRF